MNRTLRACAHYLWPLAGMVGTVAVVWQMWFERLGHVDTSDRWIPVGIGIVYALVIAYLLVKTRVWTLRGIGQIATYTADAMVYLGIGLPAYHLRHQLTDSEINLIRATLVVGGPALLGGLVWMSVLERHDTETAQTT